MDNKYNLKLKRVEEVASGTRAFYFEKPTNFEFRAGQNADFSLLNPKETDAEGNVRTFSFITASYEEELGFATRMRNTAFKNSLADLGLQSEIEMAGPFGDFTLHKNQEVPAVFIIGGIGVTPVLSMIKEATHNQLSQKLFLFHANKTIADAPFRKDFEELTTENENFQYIQVFSEEKVNGENIEEGRMTTEILKRHLENTQTPKYYLAGPQGMVKAMREMLVNEGIDEDNIKTEEFPGY